MKNKIRTINERNKNGLNGFMYNNFKTALKDMKKLKKYLIFSVLLFFISLILGIMFPDIFKEQVLKLMKELVDRTQGMNALELIGFIIDNNIKASFIGFILGIFFALVPIGVLIVNGYVIGFVINMSIGLKGIFVLWRLFPHGIFEIPAVMISISLGIRMGSFLFVYHGKNKGKEFLKWLKDSIRIFIFIVVPLLVVAGIIEGSLIWMLG
jgi:stage II sporulation protein M